MSTMKQKFRVSSKSGERQEEGGRGVQKQREGRVSETHGSPLSVSKRRTDASQVRVWGAENPARWPRRAKGQHGCGEHRMLTTLTVKATLHFSLVWPRTTVPLHGGRESSAWTEQPHRRSGNCSQRRWHAVIARRRPALPDLRLAQQGAFEAKIQTARSRGWGTKPHRTTLPTPQ